MKIYDLRAEKKFYYKIKVIISKFIFCKFTILGLPKDWKFLYFFIFLNLSGKKIFFSIRKSAIFLLFLKRFQLLKDLRWNEICLKRIVYLCGVPLMPFSEKCDLAKSQKEKRKINKTERCKRFLDLQIEIVLFPLFLNISHFISSSSSNTSTNKTCRAIIEDVSM